MMLTKEEREAGITPEMDADADAVIEAWKAFREKHGSPAAFGIAYGLFRGAEILIAQERNAVKH